MRKGYNSKEAIPKDLLTKLNRGQEETKTLAEWLAVNQGMLLSTVYKEMSLGKPSNQILALIRQRPNIGVMEIIKSIGKELLSLIESAGESLYDVLRTHRSDVVREWAACTVMANDKLALQDRLELAKPYAVDSNINVREIAWYSIRPFVEKELNLAVNYFEQWVTDSQEGIRRCAIECTRPNGVWCKHIKVIQQDPDICINLIEAVKSDNSMYVRKSIGNWLNDESKHKPEWVINLCNRWINESETQETQWIVNHALRTMRKKGMV